MQTQNRYSRLIVIVAVAVLALIVALLLTSPVSAQEEVITSTLTCPPSQVCPLGDYKYEWDEQWGWVADWDNPVLTTWWVSELMSSNERTVCWEIAGGYCLDWWCVKYGQTVQMLDPTDWHCFTTPDHDLSHVTAKLSSCPTSVELATFGAAGASLAQPTYPWMLTLLGLAGIALGWLVCFLVGHWRRRRESVWPHYDEYDPEPWGDEML